MRIAVVGAGGVGGGYGAALAKAGADVTFIARGAHLAAMKRDGLKVQSARGDTHLVPTQATDDPKTVGPVDIVLFCVKLWDVESAGAAIKPMVGPEHRGHPAAERRRRRRAAGADPGPSAVMGGVANISATIAEPGVIRQIGTVLRMMFGELDGGKSARAEAFAALCGKAGIDAPGEPDDPDRALDEVHPARLERRHHRADPAAARRAERRSRHRPVIHRCLREVRRGRPGAGVTLPADAVEQDPRSSIGNAPPRHEASMAVDLRSR